MPSNYMASQIYGFSGIENDWGLDIRDIGDTVILRLM